MDNMDLMDGMDTMDIAVSIPSIKSTTELLIGGKLKT